MSSDPVILSGATTPAGPASGATSDAAKSDAQRQQVKRLAEEFEALLMTQMMRDMRRSMVSETQSGGFGMETMSDTVDVELGRALSQAGGFGLAPVLMRAMERQIGTTSPNAAPDSAAALQSLGLPPASASPAAAPAVPGPQTVSEPTPAITPTATPESNSIHREMPGPITSGYGWRRDPFTGATQFHKGVDVAMAYGTDVHAAASGRVVFSGVNGGYGNMVVVEHSGGQQTRYAHLSALNVQTGDPVQNGQVIGKVGSSGRATGPHLHFEVVDNGRAVNPAD